LWFQIPQKVALLPNTNPFSHFWPRGFCCIPSNKHLNIDFHYLKASKAGHQIATMSKTVLQYQTPKQGAPLTEVSIPQPTPGPNEICIRTKAVGLNGLDWKGRDFGVMVQSWPAVLGIDAAGIIDSVGE
jgi:hypothetical protein